MLVTARHVINPAGPTALIDAPAGTHHPVAVVVLDPDATLTATDPAQLRDLAAVLLLAATQLEQCLDDPDVRGEFHIDPRTPVEQVAS